MDLCNSNVCDSVVTSISNSETLSGYICGSVAEHKCIARFTVGPNKLKCWCLEQTKVYGRANQEVCVQERHGLFSGFQGKAFIGRVCDFL